jgi:hypothetical protein
MFERITRAIGRGRKPEDNRAFFSGAKIIKAGNSYAIGYITPKIAEAIIEKHGQAKYTVLIVKED